MPIYEFRCKNCNNKLEEIVVFKDFVLKCCPKCGGKLKKLVSCPSSLSGIENSKFRAKSVKIDCGM